MTKFHALQFFSLIIMLMLAWLLPRKWQLNFVAGFTMVLLAWFSFSSLLLLSISSILVFYGSHSGKKNKILVPLLIGYCSIQYLLISGLQLHGDKSWQALSVLGLAYYTCRNIHYIIECFAGRIVPDALAFWHFQFYWPVMITGPIHRYQNFCRQCQRRRWNNKDASLAINRIIMGYAKIVILANYFIADKLSSLIYQTFSQEINQETFLSSFALQFFTSANDWIYLYIQFSGWSDIALSFSLLMGIKLEENFNKPYLAINLVDFWQRWHMTLSNWCRDYVFMPVLAFSRQPFLAISIAMLAMGLWHEVSVYYMLWGFYHAIGIAICRVFQRGTANLAPPFFDSFSWRTASRVLTFSFLFAGPPVILFFEQLLTGGSINVVNLSMVTLKIA